MEIQPASFRTKLPRVGTTIFTVMSALATEHQAVNLAQDFPDFDCSPELIELVSKAMKEGHNQYAPMAGLLALRERIAEKTELLYGYAPDPVQEITVTSGATEAIFAAIAAVVTQGDEVIVLEPCYDSYIPAIELSGGKAIPIALNPLDYSVNWPALQAAITSQTRLIIINSPHNPTGAIFTSQDVLELKRIVKDTEILILSDEVYEHIIFDGQIHYSVLADPELRSRSFVISSFGKTFHTTGWKIGYCVAPDYLSREFRKVHQFLTFSTFTPIQHALAAYLKTPSHYLQLPAFYEDRRQAFAALAQATPFRMLPTKGTYFQLASFAHLSDESDVEYAIRLTKEAGVTTIPVSVFYQEATDHKVIRFCFAKKDATLKKATEQLSKFTAYSLSF